MELSNWYTVPYCVSSDVDNAYNCNFPLLINSLSKELDSNGIETKDMILQYCSSLLWNQNDWRIYYAKPNILSDNRDWSHTFDSHQSLFVYLLCSSTVNKSGSLNFSEIFKWDVGKILKLQQMINWKDQCSPNGSLNECDMSMYATEIFSAIMSDVFKIKYAQIFHIDSVETFQDKNKRINAFLSWYFKITDEKYIKEFQNTVDIIDSDQKYYKSVLETLKLFDNSLLAKKASESGCPVDENMVWVDFIACALHGSQWKWMSLNPSFETFFYNEVMFYRIFVSYYWNWVQAKIEKWLLDEKDKEILQLRAIDFKSYADLQIDAAKQTLHNFEEFNMSYPLHIGLLLYQEKLKEFRNKYFPFIIQSFYSLSEKLQNVQLPQ